MGTGPAFPRHALAWFPSSCLAFARSSVPADVSSAPPLFQLSSIPKVHSRCFVSAHQHDVSLHESRLISLRVMSTLSAVGQQLSISCVPFMLFHRVDHACLVPPTGILRRAAYLIFQAVGCSACWDCRFMICGTLA